MKLEESQWVCGVPDIAPSSSLLRLHRILVLSAASALPPLTHDDKDRNDEEKTPDMNSVVFAGEKSLIEKESLFNR